MKIFLSCIGIKILSKTMTRSTPFHKISSINTIEKNIQELDEGVEEEMGFSGRRF